MVCDLKVLFYIDEIKIYLQIKHEVDKLRFGLQYTTALNDPSLLKMSVKCTSGENRLSLRRRKERLEKNCLIADTKEEQRCENRRILHTEGI